MARKPRKLKLPKKPKSKTIASMENYLKRVAEVKKTNAANLKKWESDKKKISLLRNKVKSIRK